MAHRMRSPVVLTRYSSRPESLSYFLSELKNIRESQEMDHTETQESDSSDQDEGELNVYEKSVPCVRVYSVYGTSLLKPSEDRVIQAWNTCVNTHLLIRMYVRACAVGQR